MSTGVILAGGRSTRFGETDKVVAELAGVPMIRRVAKRLADAVDAVVINCRRDQCESIAAAMDGYPHDVGFAIDEEPDRGPMAGIYEGLRAVDSEYAVVVACDMPFVDPAFVQYLLERVAGHEAAVPRLEDRWFQTTQAAYHADAMATACEDALDDGERKIIEPLFELDYVVLDEPDVREHATLETFRNVNTRGELERAAADLG
ncbi:molybdenum cofactor guanylyltransferase [Natrialbaceae archaeon AArc-T1-2]|uniref:molybdenum cofactor guanylyltransferase n=1 Tax=Natrialbaceae archaeon AArc-T1-2 TaxID=3053904 RepID=UPI00255AEFAC|nr:molybdenum cofactor guanylyltransferase [Natrialbaceae archaeon AArc-T1-2]WIV67155.1 molybdenum cofactor guanylyltransferase [Natrialbaceae archaeon AArc-T1-2]